MGHMEDDELETDEVDESRRKVIDEDWKTKR
jgi:hypothetical protein